MNRQHHWMSRVRNVIAAFICLGLYTTPDLSQSPPTAVRLTAGPSYTGIESKPEPQFPNVDLAFELRGHDGSPIAPRPSELKLYSQGQEIGTATSIRTFEQTGYGVTAILALDASGSMKGEPLNTIHASIAKFVNQARPQDKVAVLTFADQTQVDVPFGASQATLANELQTVKARGRFTRLYDGLINSLALFTNSQPRRRQLLVISDGHDEGSNHTITEAILRAKSLGVVIDSIGLTKDRGQYLAFLQQISLETGGAYVRAQSAQQLEALIGQGIQATRVTPVAAFKLENVTADGKLLSTQLRWQPGNLSATAFIQTPKGTLAPKLIPYFSNLWVWGLGGCFVVGVVLLALSWRGSRPQPIPTSTAAASYPAPALRTAMPPQSAPFSPTIDQRVSAASSHSPAVRAHTLVEGPLTKNESPQTSKFQLLPQPTQMENETLRGNTEFAAYFNAPAIGPFARLIVKNGSLAGQAIPITAADFALGAVQGNNLLLPGDTTISGQHARFHWENSMLYIEDNHSTNGTYLNRLRLSPGRHLLKPGDEIGIGQTIIVVEHA